MKSKPDNYYDLAIVDPPYGIGASAKSFINGTSKTKKDYYKDNCWDKAIPAPEYFAELMRVSKNQIIWGGNYFTEFLKPSRCWIFWDKTIHGNSYADGELAWTSFDKVVRYYRKNICQVEVEGQRIHPTQKPISLYRWLLQKYAKQGDKILDTHGGSMSSAIACDMEGFDLDICEIDLDYFEAGKKRFETHKQQTTLF
jgi:site-specific DNA-methyltransferase (adenine-specific)